MSASHRSLGHKDIEKDLGLLLPVVTYEIMMTRIEEDRARSLARYRLLHASQDHVTPDSDNNAKVIELPSEEPVVRPERLGA